MKRTRKLLAAICFCGLAANAYSAGPFEGTWTYAESTGWMVSVEMDIVQDGKSVTGSWSYDRRDRSWSGNLAGEVKGSRLVIKRCIDEGSGWGNEKPACPQFGQTDSYMEFKEGEMRWYAAFPDSQRGYLQLKKEHGPRIGV